MQQKNAKTVYVLYFTPLPLLCLWRASGATQNDIEQFVTRAQFIDGQQHISFGRRTVNLVYCYSDYAGDACAHKYRV